MTLEEMKSRLSELISAIEEWWDDTRRAIDDAAEGDNTEVLEEREAFIEEVRILLDNAQSELESYSE